ncbi:hypothetical protein EGR_08178 [Echinococcus granulosus]|uniref:Uncharacterized protein n=1 Tax=Echinococcus granulosus TaxID=6210 RepID=U6JDJ6_ECHGR|nr:hypothetical protein EGR_08178 [Echinococcus granulosus]EUB56941.1 hypothetical protein EGR_08178 [Echinococcus granulosus]CDS22177.1 hypothetical protein EgrG_000338900 [Echinococcus granulosus]
MPLDSNNNATIEINSPQPQRRSLILIPLGPAEEPPVFNLALNLNGARKSFLTGIDDWAMKRPTNCKLIHRLVDCCKANLEMVPITCDTFSKSSLMDQAKWFEEIFSMLLPIEGNDSAILHLACVRQQVRSNGRHVRLVILLTYLDEMLSSMLYSHDITKEVLTPCCKAYATLLCFAAALSPLRKLAIELIQSTKQSLSVPSQVQLPQNQQVGFGASVAVRPAKMSESMRDLRVYQETFCRWSIDTVQFEHTAIFYTSGEKPAALERHALRVRASRNSDLIYQSFEFTMHQQPKPQSQQNQLQVPASSSLLTPTKPAHTLRVNSVSDITFEDDVENSGSDKMITESGSEETLDQQEVQQIEAEEEGREQENSEESTIWDTAYNDKEVVAGRTSDANARFINEKDGFVLISAFLSGIKQDAYVLRTGSLSRLQSDIPTRISVINRSQRCASSSAENTGKEMGDEEEEEREGEMILTGEEPIKKTSELLDTETSYADSVSQTVPEMRCSTTPKRPYTLSVALRASEDEGEEEESVDDEKNEARRGRSDNSRTASFELTTVGAFKLNDGSPIQIMLAGGSVMKHKQILIEMQRYLLREKANTFSASDKLRKYLESEGTSRFTILTLSDIEDEERGGIGGVGRRGSSQTRGAKAMSLIEGEADTEAPRVKDSRRTSTFKVREGAPLKLRQLRQSQWKRWRAMWEKYRRYVREEAGSFLEGCRCRPIVFVDDETDCGAVAHLIGRTTETTVGHFSLCQDAPTQVTTMCHSCFKRRQNVWSKQQRLLHEEAETFLAQKLVLREGKQSASLLSLPHPLPSLTADSTEAIDIGPARILVTSNRREDGGVVAHIITEFPLDPVPPDNPQNLHLVFDVAMPEESV